MARRNAQLRSEGPLQRGIAAAMVGMQVGVDDAGQGLPAQRMLHEGQGLGGVVT